MKRWFLISAAAVALSTGTAWADYTLHVLHLNDFHSRVESINKFDSTCEAEAEANGECFGGIARLASKVRELRDQLKAEGQNVILLDAGDQYQGSLFYSTYKGKDTVEFMNELGFDAMAVGNHEFDDGPDGLAVLAGGAKFPVISGNIDVSGSEALQGKVKEMATLEVGGQKIGVISALATDTPETSSPGDKVVFRDDLESLKADVDTLKAEGVTKILALTHVGYKRDQEIAQDVAGLSAVIGGHSHTLLGPMEGAQGPYPTLVKNPNGAEIPVVTSYAYGKYLGHLVLTWDDKGKLIKAEGEPILLDHSVVPDAQIAARVKELSAPIDELKKKVVAEIAAPIDADRKVCRQQECEMGNVVANAMLDRVRDQGVVIAIENGGGLRASIGAGKVTRGAVLSVLPFQNTLSTFELKGVDLIAALENGASQYEEGAGRFAQVAGLKYKLDPNARSGSRISDVQVKQGGNWVPIDPTATYGVVSNNYLRAGGDGYKIFETNAINAYDFGPDLADVLTDYLAKQGPGYKPVLDGRITVKPLVTPEPEAKPEAATGETAPKPAP
ncbi:bifunctional metallophosphatase/5'-nucleotidase [Paracoccus aminophilus]|uniref:5'-nucleotidase n=1 Tax=Paracoccus aminophilus JCM 7686 TaxID=1367847 RepID=S5XRK6_PARAH|nr:bifunctional metallophosphatase/5'-nucleotidase [Paracoccus aminophilus]AGT07722.1 5'-nucleotidase [Paracoccus aminophilus JCM 7686]